MTIRSTETPMNAEDAGQTLHQLINGYRISQAIRVAASLHIADHLAGGPRTSHDLAATTVTHPDSLYRLLRALAAADVLHECHGPDILAYARSASTFAATFRALAMPGRHSAGVLPIGVHGANCFTAFAPATTPSSMHMGLMCGISNAESCRERNFRWRDARRFASRF